MCIRDRLTADAHDAPLSKSDLASQLTAKLLSLPERPTAVCVETDQVAIALVKELRKQQLNVPEDISVLGFDDAEIAQAADLSTICQEPIELGRIAGRKVLQLLRNEPLEHPHEMCIRDSYTIMPIWSTSNAGCSGSPTNR